jgi:hypothetical protein
METRIEDTVAAGTVTPAFLTLDASFDRVELMLEQLRTGANARRALAVLAARCRADR